MINKKTNNLIINDKIFEIELPFKMPIDKNIYSKFNTDTDILKYLII